MNELQSRLNTLAQLEQAYDSEVAKPTPEQDDDLIIELITRKREFATLIGYEADTIRKLLAVATAASKVIEAAGGIHMTGIFGSVSFQCESCGYRWIQGKPQEHAPDCAYAALERTVAVLEEDDNG